MLTLRRVLTEHHSETHDHDDDDDSGGGGDDDDDDDDNDDELTIIVLILPFPKNIPQQETGLFGACSVFWKWRLYNQQTLAAT